MIDKEALLALTPEKFSTNPEESLRLFIQLLEELVLSNGKRIKTHSDLIKCAEQIDFLRRSLLRDYQDQASLIDFLLERGLWEDFRKYEEETNGIDHLQNIRNNLFKGSAKKLNPL